MRLITRALAAAALAVAAAGAGVVASPGSPAAAATCGSAGGVTVVVDFKSLGEGAPATCDTDGGGQKAASLFTGNGFQLTYAQRTPGFVCRVQGVPTADPCVNTSPSNAYWGLWWSDGRSGKWTYSTAGVGSLTIPAGGSVALAWDDVDGQSTPGVAPPKHAASGGGTPSASPTVKPTPTATPTTKPTPQAPPASPTQTAAADPTPTTSPTASVSGSPGPSPLPAESAAPTPSPTPTSSASTTEPVPDAVEAAGPTQPVATDDDGLPVWLPVAVLVVLFGGAAVLLVVRRRPGA